jgi:hypothetical protein
LEDEARASRRKYVRLDEAVWAEIEAAWESGEVTLEELANRYDVNRRTLQAHFSKRGVEKGARAVALATVVRERLDAADAAEADGLAERARATRDRAFRSADLVEELLLAQLDQVRADPTQVIKVAAAAKALSLAAATLERVHAIKARALGLDRDEALGDELPVLEFIDLSVNDIERLRAEQDADDAPIVEEARPLDVELSDGRDEIVDEFGPDGAVGSPMASATADDLPILTDSEGIRIAGQWRR